MLKWVVRGLRLFTLILTTCGYLGVYFNLFYNAQNYYKKGLKKEKIHKGSGKSDFEKSIEKCLKVLNEYPDSKFADDALFLLGMNYYYIGEYEKAAEQLGNYLAIYPGSKRIDEVKFYRAICFIELGNYTEARIILKELQERKRWKEKAVYYTALSYKKEKSLEDAQKYFEIFLKKYKKSKLALKARLELGDILEKKNDTVYAIKWYEDYIRNIPTTKEKYEVMVRLGNLYLKKKRYDDVIQLLKNAIGIYPEYNDDINLLLGKAYYFKKEYNKAISYFDNIFKPEKAAEAFYYKGLIYEEKNEIEKAVAYYDSVKIKSQTSDFYILSLRRKSVLESALQDTSDSVRIDPAENQFLLAQTYFVNFEDYDKAVEEYKKLLEKYPQSPYAPKAMYAIAWIYKYRKNDTLWRSLFRKIIQEYPNTEYSKYAERELEK